MQMVESVIGEAPAHLVEEVVPLFDCVQKALQAADFDIARRLELGDPRIEDLRLIDGQSLVGTECRIDLCFEIGGRNRFVVRQVVGRIVGGAQRPDVELIENSVRR